MFTIYYLVMIRVNIHQAKTHLSRYVERLLGGEVIQLCRRNVPVAELRALTPRRSEPRPIGLAGGVFTVPDSFFEPLPENVADAFDNPA